MFSKFFPLVKQLGDYLKLAVDHYADLRSTGQNADPDMVAFFLRSKMDGWDPQVSGKSLLDDDTRDAGARFLAGVAVNFVGTQ